MARIRTIKPGFFASEDVSALPLRARLTWIGLWTHCDDAGRTKDNVKLIKAAVWPLDEVSLREVEEDLVTLADHGRIVRYEVDGKRYLEITNWREHQKINKPTPSKFPPPPGDSATAPETLPEPYVNPPGKLPEPSRGEGKGKEGKGREGERAHARETPPPGSRPRCKRHTGIPDDDPGPPCVACRDARLNAEAASRPPVVPVPDWCRRCDHPDTRLVERDDGRVNHCPDCHPKVVHTA